MTVFSEAAFDDHEQVVFFKDRDCGLEAIIAIHSTTLGPAAGGVRMWPYESEAAALNDVLRLSQGMSYKNAMAGLALGGGKAVIIGDPKTEKTPELMRALGRCVERLAGRYVTAEDVGMSVKDMAEVLKETRYVTGTSGSSVSSGDPSPYTAHGVFCGIQAALRHKFGTDDLKGRTVAVQGLGNVGRHLVEELYEAGAKLVVADIAPERVDHVVGRFDATAVDVDDILVAEADVLAPCALGAIINDETVNALRAPIVAGGANNQLAEKRHGIALKERGILFAPDYVINAGGIMNCSLEYENKFVSQEASMAWVEQIADTLSEIFIEAERSDRATNEVAEDMARARIGRADTAAPRAQVA